MSVVQAPRRMLVFQGVLLTIGVLLFLWVLYRLSELLLLLLLAGLLAAALYPAVIMLERKRCPRKLAIVLCYGVLFLLAWGLGYLLADIVVAQGQALLQSLPERLDQALRLFHRLPLDLDREALTREVSSHTQAILSQGLLFLRRAFNYIQAAVQGVFGIITILVFGFLLLDETEYFERTALQLVPATSRSRVSRLLREIASKAGAYTRGQLLVMLGTGLLTAFGLYLLGVPYALTLGLITFLLDIVPIMGPFLAAGFGVLVALGKDPMLAVWALLVYVVVQQIENQLLSPLILGRTLGLHSFWIIFSIFAGGALLGVTGVILAVPAAVAIGLLVQEFYVRPLQMTSTSVSSCDEGV